jgi:hypothetical protein
VAAASEEGEVGGDVELGVGVRGRAGVRRRRRGFAKFEVGGFGHGAGKAKARMEDGGWKMEEDDDSLMSSSILHSPVSILVFLHS